MEKSGEKLGVCIFLQVYSQFSECWLWEALWLKPILIDALGLSNTYCSIIWMSAQKEAFV